jgi:hypothetical protein
MKPTIENLKKIALEANDPAVMGALLDNVLFYMAGVKAMAQRLHVPLKDVEVLLDEARRLNEIIENRIIELTANNR